MNNTTTATQNKAISAPNQLSNSNIIVVCLYTVIFIFGLVGNLLVIRYFGFKSKHSRLYHTYLIHLAIADFISSTITPAYFIYGIVNNNIWHYGQVSCTIISATGPLTVNVSAWLLVSIAYERYRGIYSPFKPRMTKLRIHITVACTWIISAVALIPYMRSIKLLDGKYCVPKWSRPEFELAYAIGTLLLQSILPIIYMTFTMKRILHTLRNRMKMDNVRQSKMSKFSMRSCETSLISKDSSRAINTSSIVSPTRSITSNGSTKCSLVDHNTSLPDPDRKEFSPISSKGKRKSFTNASNSNKRNGQGRRRRSSSVDETFCSKSLHYRRQIQKSHFSTEPVSKGLPPIQRQGTLLQLFVNRQSAVENNENTTRKNMSPNKSNLSQCQQPLLLTKSTSTPVLQQINTKEHPLSLFKTKPDASSWTIKAGNSMYKKMRTIFSNQVRNRAKQRRISILIVTFSVFVVCSLPYNTFYVAAIIIYDFLKDRSQLDTLLNINLWLSTLVVANSIMNCFIYAGMDNHFKQYCVSFFDVCRGEKNRKKKGKKRCL